MAITKEEILDAITNMSVIEISELISMIEKKFNITAILPVKNNTENINQKIEEKNEFNVFLTKIGNNKIAVIKAVRSALGLGLKESKELVESVPSILKEGVDKINANKLKSIIEEAGASVELK